MEPAPGVEAEVERALLEVFVEELRKRSRKVLTGDEKLRIRDHVRVTLRDRRGKLVDLGAQRVDDLKRKVQTVQTRVKKFAKKPPVVKTVDKLLFTAGVGWVLATEYLLLEHSSEVVAAWFVGTMVPLMGHRLITYSRTNLIYFCLDFCYFINALAFACVFGRLGPSSPLFRAVFAMANGPLVTAVLVWRNSFVFHDLDRVCSTVLHALPPIWTYAERWAEDAGAEPSPATCDRGGSLRLADFGLTVILYLLWQVLYILKTEWWDRAYIACHNEEATSLRWLVRSKTSIMNVLCKKCAEDIINQSRR